MRSSMFSKLIIAAAQLLGAGSPARPLSRLHPITMPPKVACDNLQIAHSIRYYPSAQPASVGSADPQLFQAGTLYFDWWQHLLAVMKAALQPTSDATPGKRGLTLAQQREAVEFLVAGGLSVQRDCQLAAILRSTLRQKRIQRLWRRHRLQVQRVCWRCLRGKPPPRLIAAYPAHLSLRFCGRRLGRQHTPAPGRVHRAHCAVRSARVFAERQRLEFVATVVCCSRWRGTRLRRQTFPLDQFCIQTSTSL
jgi:hypothetical protein